MEPELMARSRRRRWGGRDAPIIPAVVPAPPTLQCPHLPEGLVLEMEQRTGWQRWSQGSLMGRAWVLSASPCSKPSSCWHHAGPWLLGSEDGCSS